MLAIIENHRAELDGFCRRHHVGRLELFGSAVTGAFQPAASDLDFLVEFLPLQPGTRADAYFGLLHGMEDLFHRKIDLVMAGAIKNSWFQRSIDRQRTLLYAA
jgi:uncharacterized protein